MKKSVIGILAHVDAGKTTLSEALLYESGAIRKAGRVDDKDTFLDNFDIEKERGITVFSKQAKLKLKDLDITLIDTPGHADFSAEMERTLQVLDYAILVISGAEGVQGHTRTLWRLLRRYDIPAFIFVNKMDRQTADRKKLINEIKNTLSGACVSFDPEDSGIRDEEISLCDEELLEKYIDSGSLTDDEISQAIADRKIFPCFFGSALKASGISEFSEALSGYVLEREYPEKFGARVFKIMRDGNERLTFLKITGGSLKVKEMLGEEKVNGIRIYSGPGYSVTGEVHAGDVCAVTGPEKTFAGQIFGMEKEKVTPELMPVMTYSVILPDGVDVREIYRDFLRLCEEVPELCAEWNENDRSINVKVMGQVQTEVLRRMVKDRLGIDISFGDGSIVYKETISDAVLGVGHYEPLRHYAEVHLLIEPSERGSGIVTDTACSEDILDKNWQRLIMTHLSEKKHRGVLTGSELTDVRITLVNGRAHIKHTEGGDFRQAVYRAVRQGLMQAHSILLEPYYRFIIELPSECAGRALTDIQRMCGTAQIESTDGNASVITGRAPVSEVNDYGRNVAEYTHGKGHISFDPDGYDICHNSDDVIDRIKYEPQSDMENTADSVFCANGAGYAVPWYEVFDHMHLENDLEISGKNENNGISRQGLRPDIRERLDIALGVEEVDRIVDMAGGANKAARSSMHQGMYKKFRKPSETVTKTFKAPKQREKYLLVDGYNVIFAWDELSRLAAENIDSARGKLLDIMCCYQAAVSMNLIVVFDAYRVKNHETEITDYHNIHVVYTKEAETADRYIEKFAHRNGALYDITVVTSDGMEQVIIRGEGCKLVSSREFEAMVLKTCQEHVELYGSSENGKVYISDVLDKNDTR